MQGRVSRVSGASRFYYVLGVIVGGLLSARAATAAITLTSDPNLLAQAMEHTPGTITGASFVALPPTGTPHGIGNAPLDGFPTDGATFAILTNGDASLADQPNSSGDAGADDNGGNVRGPTNWDVSILKIDLDVPPLANCLSIDFRFLSDEYPEWVGGDFNDAFIAELDNSTWSTSGPTITAPDNFAFDPSNSQISINGAGATSMTVGNAVGTTYDGATPVLTASTPITPGTHSLYLSIFDVSDRGIDAAVFLDRLVLSTTDPMACQPGATVLSTTKSTSTPSVFPGGTVQYTININNASAGAVTLNTITDELPTGFSYVPGSSSGITTTDPGISGQNLTWNGPFIVPATSTVSLTFNALASLVPDDYFNNASATASGSPVTPSGPSAKVTVNPAQVCGNGTLDPGEQCDDGNLNDGDGCDSNCKFTGCGNGVVTGSEVCDDGNLNNGDGCDSNCTPTGCGNGIVTGGEQCDDGNLIDGDGCSYTCQVEHFCGNGIVEPGETCDPPGTVMPPNGNQCRLDCTYCGDGVVNGVPGSESCDDGNTNNSDGCGNFCLSGSSAALDNFECYRTRVVEKQPLIPPRNATPMTLEDQFGTSTRNVYRPVTLCNPADKDGEDPGAPSHADHLVSYQLRAKVQVRDPNYGRNKLPPRSQKVVNEFGTIYVDPLNQNRMLVPSAKMVASQPPPLTPSIDHFTCYRVRRTKGTAPFVQQTVTVDDEFGSATIDVRRPTKLCAPVNVNNADPSASAHAAHLMCYHVTRRFPPIGRVYINNEYGPGQLYPRYRDELCVPSLKNP